MLAFNGAAIRAFCKASKVNLNFVLVPSVQYHCIRVASSSSISVNVVIHGVVQVSFVARKSDETSSTSSNVVR